VDDRDRDEQDWLVDAVVELADTLVADFDVCEFLTGLADRLVRLLPTADVGVVVADGDGRLHVMATSSQRVHALELFEVQRDEGPCIDAFRKGEPVLDVALADAAGRWPRFTRLASEAGFQLVHALPMRHRDEVIGALNILDTASRPIGRSELRLARGLADVASIGLLQQRAVGDARRLVAQLEQALESRVVIEQAKGMVHERLGIELGAAFSLLRTHARRTSTKLRDVAAMVLDGRLPVEALTDAEAVAADRRS
jgi:GAF domain-containing protein